MTKIHPKYNVVVIAPLLEEAEAFLHIVARDRNTPKEKQDSVEEISFKDQPFDVGAHAVQKYSGIIVCPEKMGRTETAVAVTRACMMYRPDLVMLIGRAGGLKYWGDRHSEDLQLGDVIVSTSIIDLDLRKMFSVGEDDIRYRALSLSGGELRCAENVILDNKWRRYLPSYFENNDIKAHLGSVISGSVILSSYTRQAELSSYLQEYTERFRRKPIAIEMEGIGAKIAVDSLSISEKDLTDLKLVMIRAISDFADEFKNDDEIAGRDISRFGAAAFATAYLKKYFSDSFQNRKLPMPHPNRRS